MYVYPHFCQQVLPLPPWLGHTVYIYSFLSYRILQRSLWPCALCAFFTRWGTLRQWKWRRNSPSMADHSGQNLWPVEMCDAWRMCQQHRFYSSKTRDLVGSALLNWVLVTIKEKKNEKVRIWPTGLSEFEHFGQQRSAIRSASFHSTMILYVVSCYNTTSCCMLCNLKSTSCLSNFQISRLLKFPTNILKQGQFR